MGGGKWKTFVLLISVLPPPTFLYRHVKEARQITASDGFSKKRTRSHTSGPLMPTDSDGNPFNMETATSYCAPSPYSKMTRDVILYTKDANEALKFLVKPWDDFGRGKIAEYGNPFASFLYRPPNDIPRIRPVKDWEIFKWAPTPGCWLITYVHGGNPNWEKFQQVLSPEAMEAADNLDLMAVVMPEFGEFSGMTSVVSFMEVKEEEVKMDVPHTNGTKFELKWIDLEQALDIKQNVQAGLVAKFLQSPDQKTGVSPPEGLEQYDSYVVLPLIPGLRKFNGWRGDPALMQYTMRALLWANGLQEPAPRTCDPAAPDAPLMNASLGVVGMGEAAQVEEGAPVAEAAVAAP